MAQIIRTKVGPVVAQDGSYPEFRGGRTGELIKSDTHGWYQEACSRGNVFGAVSGTSVLGSQSTGTSLSTFGLFNPPNSGILISVLSAAVVVGTFNATAQAFAPSVGLAPIPNNYLVTFTTNVGQLPVNCLIGFGGAGGKPAAETASVGQVTSVGTLAVSLAAAPVVFKTILALWQDLIANSFTAQAHVDVAGSVALLPNNGVIFQQTLNGGSALASWTGTAHIIWEESSL